MEALGAPWLGTWEPPWDLGRGRRWGDIPWALAAISQAWLMGGREGRWPVASWQARTPRGPGLAAPPEAWQARPPCEWISRLRHGTSQILADRRGKRENEALAWAWEALLAGDGAPWMALGSTWLDLRTRMRWIPVLGAVDAGGTIHLPPYLEVLLPEALRCLPQGWWRFLLESMDASGRLLPEGVLPRDAPMDLLLGPGAPYLEPLRLGALPDLLVPHRGAPWLHELPDGSWMLDPHLRAWGRGRGAHPEALAGLVPPSLAFGRAPEAWLVDILGGRAPAGDQMPPGWMPSLRADLEGEPPPVPPAPSGHPTLDRMGMRWGGEAAEVVSGYPPWDALPHPCADPFHWMAQGRRSYWAEDMETALRAFTLAHAHFERLGSSFWASRAAANASYAALYWGDLPSVKAWRAVMGPQPSPYREMDEATLIAARGDWAGALELARRLLLEYPEQVTPWFLIAQWGLASGQRDPIVEALPHLPPCGLTLLLERSLGELGEAPEDLDPEARLQWEFHRLKRGEPDPGTFWAAWAACRNQPLRLDLALSLLEARPRERMPGRLVQLQVLADRSGSPFYQERLAALWPIHEDAPDRDPRTFLQDWLAQRPGPAWILWGDGPERAGMLGSGIRPPEGVLGRLRQDGRMPPVLDGELVWWGFPVQWEGAPVGSLVLALDPGVPLERPLEPQLLAPWIARMNARKAEPPPAEAGALLTDGSEPMASMLRDLARVAPSELPVLILGPTGSGKELAAREIHARSGRMGPLVPVNCSAFAESLLESELFGHVKGAFTGADRERRGAIETADHGTLFLDEVADLSPRIQSMFLRVLQEREVRRVGSDRALRVDVRFLAATHKSLEQMAASGTFRRDLLFRLQGAVLTLPSLAERRHEFPYLLPRLVAQVALQAKREPPDLSPGLARALARLPWPGNFRELFHALERALLRCEDGLLRAEHFPELAIPTIQERTWEEATHAFQRRLLLDTLRQQRFNATEAARSLGLTRPALYTAARRLGLDLVAERERARSEGLE